MYLRYWWLVFGNLKHSWLSGSRVRLKFARLRSQIRFRHVAEFLIIRGSFLLFLISFDRAAFWSCSRKCLRSAASPLCKFVLKLKRSACFNFTIGFSCFKILKYIYFFQHLFFSLFFDVFERSTILCEVQSILCEVLEYAKCSLSGFH